MDRSRTGRGGRCGFTIIELMVAVGIILILLSIVVVGVQQAMARARASHTKALLLDAVAAAAQFKVTVERGINHINMPGGLVDWTALTNSNLNANDGNSPPGNETDRANFAKRTTQRFLWKAQQVPTASNTIAKLGPGIYKPAGSTPIMGNQYLIDAWEQPVAYVWKNTNPDDPNDPKADNFLPQFDGLYFASPGLDGKWGDAREALKKSRGLPVSNAADAAAAADNLYSFVSD